MSYQVKAKEKAIVSVKLNKLKEKLGLKKSDTADGEGKSQESLRREDRHSLSTEGSAAIHESPESLDLTEKLKAAFHEKPKEDKELERRKELDKEIRGFRKSFRQEVRNEAKVIRKGVVGEVKGTISTIKAAATTKRKEKDTDQPST
jgi:hypothetical protein